MAETLTKAERLSGRTAVSDLMKKGRWGAAGCLKYCFLMHGDEGLNRIMVSVPKKNFKRAVKRNLLKRRIRESYRTQKGLLNIPGRVDILFFYNSKDVLDSETIRKDLAQVLYNLRSL